MCSYEYCFEYLQLKYVSSNTMFELQGGEYKHIQMILFHMQITLIQMCYKIFIKNTIAFKNFKK